MKTIGYYVKKGGTGKTTAAVNTAAELSLAGHKTLLVDGDPQGNASRWMGPTEYAHEVADVLKGDIPLAEAVIAVRDRLWILPTFEVGSILQDWADANLDKSPKAITRTIIDPARALGFEFVVIDLSPGLGALERQFLIRCDEVIGVIKAEVFSVDGLAAFEYDIGQLRDQFDARFILDKLVVNQINQSFADHRAFSAELETRRYSIHTVGQTTAVPASQRLHLTLREYDPKNKFNDDFRRLAEVLGSRQYNLLGA